MKEDLTRAGRDWQRSGHPWLYRTHFHDEKALPTAPSLVPMAGHWHVLSPLSEIRLRRFGPLEGQPKSPENAPVIESPEAFGEYFAHPLEQHLHALFLRKRSLVGNENCFRWVFSEADALPGLVLDVFESTVVAQIQTAPMERFWPVFRAAIEGAFRRAVGPELRLIELRNAPSRRREGLEVEEIPAERKTEGQWIRWNGFEWWMNPGGPQKTGAYLDQKENHLAAAVWAKRIQARQAWDLCAFEGGFGLHLARAGAEVLAVDQSATALETAGRNRDRNAIPAAQFRTLEANVFDELRARHQAREKVDFIVLDPPSFVRSRKDKANAMRGLKELNLRALHCLRPGGILVTCTCSHHVSPSDLGELVHDAALDGKRRVKILEEKGPSPDHAPLDGFPESRYLSALYLEVL